MRRYIGVMFVALLAVSPKTMAAAAQDQVTFDKWVEPKEQCFSVEVPKGWEISGGVHWHSPIDPRSFLRVSSPDHKVQIFIDDPDILKRIVPNPISNQMGWTEDRVVQAETGPILIQRFLTGSQYAQQHAAWRLCRNPRWVKVGDLPALSNSITAAIEPLARSSGLFAQASAGEAGFQCNDAQGYVFATTLLTSSLDPRNPILSWIVYKLSGFIRSDPMKTMQARYIMDHMMATWIFNPRWDEALNRKVNDVTGRAIGVRIAMAAQVLRNSARNASNDLARLNHPNQGVNVRPGERKSSSVNTILGTKEVCDAIGRCKNVSNDYNEIYMDHSGNTRPGRPGGGPPDNSGVWSPTYTQ
jgi:hypothetical protein